MYTAFLKGLSQVGFFKRNGNVLALSAAAVIIAGTAVAVVVSKSARHPVAGFQKCDFLYATAQKCRSYSHYYYNKWGSPIETVPRA